MSNSINGDESVKISWLRKRQILRAKYIRCWNLFLKRIIFYASYNLMDIICRVKFENPGHFHSTDKSHYYKILMKVKLW